jgi:GNAT superfamily N-acetyltransferase
LTVDKEVSPESFKAEDIDVVTVRNAGDFPEWLPREQLAPFLHESLKPYEDSVADINKAIDYVFTDDSSRGGYVLVAGVNGTPLGAVLVLETGMSGYVPENILVYIAVTPAARGKGLGGRLMKKAFAEADGDVKLHVEYDNPAKRLYERVGMVSKYAEMRYHK